MSLLAPVTDDSMPLFSASLISPEVASQLPEGYTIRPMQRGDYAKGFLDVLRVLTTVGDVTEEVCIPSTCVDLGGRRRLTHTTAMEPALRVARPTQRPVLPPLHPRPLLPRRRHRRAHRRAQVHPQPGARRTH